MSDNHSSLFAERIEHADHVADEVKQRIALDFGRLIRQAVAAHVGRNGMKPRRRQCVQLVAPGIPGLWESMTEQHERAAALLGDMNADAIGLNGTVRRLTHGDSVSGMRRMVLHRRELGLHFSAEIGLRFGRIDVFTALAQGDCRLGTLECVA